MSSNQHPQHASSHTMAEAEIRKRIDSVPHWYHRIEIVQGIVTPGINDTPTSLKLLDLPKTMTGLRVLDIGARDGFYSFECERRGAEVVAIDYASSEDTGFRVAKELLGSKVDLIHDNVYNVCPEKYGLFDIVLFLGVLYHLRDPMRAIDSIRSVCRGELFLETHTIDQSILSRDAGNSLNVLLLETMLEMPLMQFYPRDTLNRDFTNYWGPNMQCVESMLEEANFTVTSRSRSGDRGVFRCKINSDAKLAYFSQIEKGVI
jgi:tRNA (mo5U34)-methyltransferase